MNNAFIILGTIVLVSLLGLLGGVLLLWKEALAKRISHFFVSFGAGALMGIVFFDLLPEALENADAPGEPGEVLALVLLGFIIFYLIEKGISWYHSHYDEEEEQVKVPRSLIIIADSVHNAIDGALIAATFLVDVRLGLITALGVLVHELPQEVGDFGILLHSGLSRARVIWYNVISAGTALIGAGIVLVFGSEIKYLSSIIALVAGNFLYIAAVDLIPATHHHGARRHTEAIHMVIFVTGVALMAVISRFIEG